MQLDILYKKPLIHVCLKIASLGDILIDILLRKKDYQDRKFTLSLFL